MPLHTSIVGESISPQTQSVDARWLMAYAASLNDYNPRYLDTQTSSVIAHPVFPVCLEWPVILDMRSISGSQHLSAEEAARGVHAAHDLHIYKPITQDQTYTTDATMLSAEEKNPGAVYVMRLDTRDEHGDLVAQTYQTGIYRGVAVQGDPAPAANAPALPKLSALTNPEIIDIPVAAGLAHTYTECAKIWNPIHTDRAVALAAGLPDIILHGTATLALAVSHIVDRFAEGDPTQVTRLGGRFAAMVLMPSTIRLEAERQDDTIHYQVLNEEGATAISAGFVTLRN